MVTPVRTGTRWARSREAFLVGGDGARTRELCRCANAHTFNAYISSRKISKIN